MAQLNSFDSNYEASMKNVGRTEKIEQDSLWRAKNLVEKQALNGDNLVRI